MSWKSIPVISASIVVVVLVLLGTVIWFGNMIKGEPDTRLDRVLDALYEGREVPDASTVVTATGAPHGDAVADHLRQMLDNTLRPKQAALQAKQAAKPTDIEVLAKAVADLRKRLDELAPQPAGENK